jgi:SulP family sulfate permease
MSVGAANEMARRLTTQVDFETLIIDLSDVPMIDSSASLAVEEVIERTLAVQRKVLMVGIRPRVERVLAKVGVTDLVGPNARFNDRLSALRHAASALARSE